MIKEIFGAFVIGSSIISCAVTYFYIYRPYYRLNCPPNVVPFDKLWIVPVLFGVFNSLNMILQLTVFNQTSPFIIAFCTGAIQGLIFSCIGRFGFHFPKKLFHIEREYLVHIIAPPLYALIYVLIVQPLNMLYVLP